MEKKDANDQESKNTGKPDDDKKPIERKSAIGKTSSTNEQESKNTDKPDDDKKPIERKSAIGKTSSTNELEGIINQKIYNSANFKFLNDYLSGQVNSNLSNYYTANLGDIISNRLSIQDSTLDNQFKLADEINDLRKKFKKSVDELKITQADRENKIKELEQLKAELVAKEKISHILPRISEDGRKMLLSSEDFQGLFKNSKKCDTVVVSIDIRRSTELMLKARTPELFSKFITELSFKLSQIIISNHGIFDKFTGDGILAFFPKFYSGEQAIIHAIKAANECHFLFKEHYDRSKYCFNVFIKDVGLGIGIDYGNVTLVNTQSELTVVGVPVVYACRFSSAKAGETLLNQPAREEIMVQCPQLASFSESEINIKNEGIALGYNVSLNEAAYNINSPNWNELIQTYKID